MALRAPNSPAEVLSLCQNLYPLARQQLLRQLLEGFSPDSRPTQAQLAACVPLAHGVYCAAACRLPQGLNWDLPALEQVLSAVLGDHCQVFLRLQAQNLLQLLLDLETRAQLSGCISLLHQSLSALTPGGESPLLGVGSAVDSLDRVALSANQASIALQHAALQNRAEPVFYLESLRLQGKKGDGPQAARKALSSHIRRKNARQAHGALNRILLSLPPQHQVEDLRLLYTELCTRLLLAAEPHRSSALQSQVLGQVFSICEVHQLRMRLDALIDQLCAPTLALPGKAEIDGEILRYIDQNLLEPTLSLTAVAEQFHRSPSYISMLFKEEKGVSYIDYVNQYRIAQAAALLRHNSVPACQVYHSVGYVSPSTFHRNFVKYANQTPGEYLRTHSAL